MRKDYLTKVLDSIIDKKISKIPQNIKFIFKRDILEDVLISSSDTFTSVALDTNYNLSKYPVDPNSIVVYKEGTSTYYQRYSDWTCDAQAGTIKFLSTGSIEAGTNIVVEYKYYKAVGEMSAADILAALLTVDGPGSELDADLLDGEHGSYYTNYIDGKKILSQIVLVKKGDLEVGTDVSPMPIFVYSPGTIKEVYIAVRTAPIGASLIVDVNKNDTTIFTTQENRPEIAIGEYTATSGVPDVTALAKNDKLTIDVDQIGSTTAGADLIVLIRFEQMVR